MDRRASGAQRHADLPRFRRRASAQRLAALPPGEAASRRLEAAVRRICSGEIVITSSWRKVLGLTEIRKLFSPDIAPQVVGVVPIGRFRDDFPRYGEVLAYLKQREGGWLPWIAVDDDVRAYPGGAPVVVANPNFGFGAAEAERLVEMAEG